MKKKKITKNWLNKNSRKYYFKQSKVLGYRSRSAFKLIEMNKKFKFLKKKTMLLDLGSTPGGWSQVVKKESPNGNVLAVDIKTMEKIDGVHFVKGDLSNDDIYKKVKQFFGCKIDVVLSDMATNTSGNKSLDSFRTGELCMNAMDLSFKILNKEGVFLSKIFMGSIFDEINKKAKNYFKKVIKYKPISSKKESKEIYIYCKGIIKI